MSKLKPLLPIGLVLLITLTAVACGAASRSGTPTPVPSPAPSPTSTLEVELRPSLPAPALQGILDVDGTRLSYQCYGEGSPAIIVEAGAGDKPTLTLSWNAVILGVLPSTRICIYDRAPVNTSQQAAGNLHGLLAKIPVPGPYILVAHSLGGWHARVFAHLYPQEVAGMILVDTTPTYPDSAILLATAYPTYSPGEASGITQNRLPAADIAKIMLPSVDGLDMPASNEQVRKAGGFGDIPLVVICHTPGPNEMSPGLDPASQKQIGQLIFKVEADLARLSTRGVFEISTSSHHFISLYQPQIIIAAINQMVQELRGK
jgi:pimeloyl-ACP methyl ester carboxylesterase